MSYFTVMGPNGDLISSDARDENLLLINEAVTG